VSVTDNGVPTLDDSELFNVVVSVVSGNQAPVLAPIGTQNIDEGMALVIALNATDANGDELRFNQSGVPAFCSLTDNRDGSGSISCNPNFTESGLYSMTITVADNGAPQQSDSETFDIVVADVNGPPVLTTIGLQKGKDNRTLEILLSASDIDGNALVFSTVGMPAFCDLTDNFDGTADIICNPTLLDVGDHAMTAIVTDNGSPNRSDSETFNITIQTRSRTRDMNGDGMSDILWRNSATGQNHLYLMNAAAIIINAGINTVSDLNWEIVGNGDFNGDRKTDILWRNSITGQNWLYQMSSATIVGSLGINTVADPAWQVAGNGDYNGDGAADILWRNSVTGQNWLYLMNGATIVSSLGVNTVSIDWQIAGNGDYNGDGKADILWRNSATGQNWLYLMNGATIVSSVGVNTVSDLTWQVVGSGDYNGDGKSDILWRNSTTGQNWLYLMNGAAIAGSLGINTLSDLNWQVVNTN